MLTCSGFRNDPFLAHSPSQQDLTNTIVDLVSSRVVEVLAFQVDLGPTKHLRQPLCKIQRARTADIVSQEILKLRLKIGIIANGKIPGRQFVKRRDERLGHKSASIFAPIAV